MQVEFHSQTIGDVDVFYRLAGPADAPVVLLLHGFPTASHMFRDLIPEMAEKYRVIAPDLPGFGNTRAPPRGEFTYSFDNLGHIITSPPATSRSRLPHGIRTVCGVCQIR